jgi:hypothetical protein
MEDNYIQKVRITENDRSTERQETNNSIDKTINMSGLKLIRPYPITFRTLGNLFEDILPILSEGDIYD